MVKEIHGVSYTSLSNFQKIVLLIAPTHSKKLSILDLCFFQAPVFLLLFLGHNYCRNPDNDPHGAWCYTSDQGLRWEYCNNANQHCDECDFDNGGCDKEQICQDDNLFKEGKCCLKFFRIFSKIFLKLFQKILFENLKKMLKIFLQN